MVGTLSSLVGYAIRLESNTTKNTRLTYITTGIALRMLEHGSGRGDQGTAFDEVTVSVIYSSVTLISQCDGSYHGPKSAYNHR